MSKQAERAFSTGLHGLDHVLQGIEPGDNIVWAVDSVEDYAQLVRPYAAAAERAGRRRVYFRFADHPPLLAGGIELEIHPDDPSQGFEAFVRRVHAVVDEVGNGAVYVFDCLSSLAEAWCSDLSLGNFFRLTCPRLLELETATYFALFRDRHTPFALDPIRETAQFMLDVFETEGQLYVRPLKVQERSQSSRNTLYRRHGDDFVPVTESAVIARILARTQWPRLHSDRPAGFWRQLFRDAGTMQAAIDAGHAAPSAVEAMLKDVRRAFRVHRSGISALVEQYLTLRDFLAIRDRMIGIGSVGGKTYGMLVARAILRERDPELASRLEIHDSFFVGAEVFVTFLVQNGVWWVRERQRAPDHFLEGLEEGRRLILTGTFPPDIIEQFEGMLEYFGEAPYIVRSSSILEDARGNAFSGKYESVFVVNRGSAEKRLEALLDAVRAVYASVLDEEALRYRRRRGLLDSEERMALLIMRVSGAEYGRYYFPQAAGVGLSVNPYVWHPDIDARAGVVRLVFGLGTRAVDRHDDDYTQLVALNAPLRRPDTGMSKGKRPYQRRMDCLDFLESRLVSRPFSQVVAEVADQRLERYFGRFESGYPWITFDRLLSETPVVDDLRRMLRLLEEAYENPVDIEFTLNFLTDGTYRINLLQCRTFQYRPAASVARAEIDPAHCMLRAQGGVIGIGREERITRVVFVVPEEYSKLSEQQRHGVARLIGRLNRLQQLGDRGLMLIGPGRWGTSMASLGIPVTFAEISRASAVCEMVAMHQRLIPDVSLGTHFFNDLVEQEMLYLAFFPRKEGNRIDDDWLRQTPNRVVELIPDAAPFAAVVRMIDCDSPACEIWLRADPAAQTAVLYRRASAAT